MNRRGRRRGGLNRSGRITILHHLIIVHLQLKQMNISTLNLAVVWLISWMGGVNDRRVTLSRTNGRDEISDGRV